MDILFFIENNVTDDDLSFSGAYLPESLSDKLTALDDINAVYFSLPEGYSGKLLKKKNSSARTGNDDVSFWKDLFSKTGSRDIVKIIADSPFLDISIIKEMIDLHSEYRAEFTFSENLPPGFTCEVVSQDLIKSIPDFEEKTLPLSQVIKANINHFDVELYYKDPDIRDKRISFLLKNSRDRKIMENIHLLNGQIPLYSDIRGIVESNPEVLFLGPSYLELELTGRCDLSCIFCYRKSLPAERGDMDTALFKKILEQMSEFDLPYAIALGGSGEPLMHPKFYEIAGHAVNDPLVETIIIETNGLYADANYKDFLIKSGQKIKTIVNCNGKDSDTYRSLHGPDHFEKILQNISSLAELNGGENRVYVQIMKINETEKFLDAYYDFWEKEKVPIILQKQNVYLGRIEDRRYSDLSPLERIPCWHLQRDLFITSDGHVCFCKQDVAAESSPGKIDEHSIPELWQKKKESFIKDYNKKYPSRPDCKNCDEWYTFNL